MTQDNQIDVTIKQARANAQAALLDKIKVNFKLTNDRALGVFLETNVSTISRTRSGDRAIGASLMIRIHEATKWPVREIRDTLGHGADMYKGA